MGKASDELTVKIAESQERSDILDFGWCWPILNARNFYRVHASHPLFKNYPQVIDTRNMETAFGELDEQVVFGEEVQGVVYCGNMVSECGASTDDDVIHVHTDDRPVQCVSVNEGTKDVVHHGLECGW